MSRDSGGGEARRFARVLLVTAAALVSIAATFNVVADPGREWGIEVLPPDTSDGRAVKLELIERAPADVDTVILGDSRAQRMEPAHVERRIGGHAFNAGVPGANAVVEAEAWRTIARRAPRVRRVVILTGPEVLTFDAGRSDLGGRLSEAFSLSQTKRSLRSLLDGAGIAEQERYWTYAADGREVRAAGLDLAAVRARGGPTAEQIELNFLGFWQQWQRLRVSPWLPELDGMLADMNRRGIVPVLVLMPYHPRFIARAGPSFARMRRDSLAIFTALGRRRDFRLVDLQTPDRLRTDVAGWKDGLHLDEANTRRVFDATLAAVPELAR